MPMKVGGFKLHLLYKGVFDYDEVYKKAHDWLVFRGFQLHETKFKEKSKEYGKELEINWTAWRVVHSHVKMYLMVHIHAWDVQYIVVKKDGKKKKLMKARIYFEFNRDLDFDFRDEFGKTSFKLRLREFLYKYILLEYFDSLWEDKLRFKMYNLQTVVKEALGMQTKGNEHWDAW